jgi:hypothetical protein
MSGSFFPWSMCRDQIRIRKIIGGSNGQETTYFFTCKIKEQDNVSIKKRTRECHDLFGHCFFV